MSRLHRHGVLFAGGHYQFRKLRLVNVPGCSKAILVNRMWVDGRGVTKFMDKADGGEEAAGGSRLIGPFHMELLDGTV